MYSNLNPYWETLWPCGDGNAGIILGDVIVCIISFRTLAERLCTVIVYFCFC